MDRELLDILMVAPYPPPAGGIAHHTKALLEAVRAEGLGAIVLDINRNEGEGIVPVFGRKDLFRKVKRTKAKLVHIHSDSFDLHYHAPVAILAAKLSGKTAILSIHSGDVADYYAKTSRFKRMLMRFSIKNANVIVADNEDIARFAGSLNHGGDIHIISPFVAPPARQEPLPARLDEFAGARKPLFVSCGSPHETYQLDKVIEAFARLLELHRDAGLVITRTDAANEEGWSALRRKVEGLGLTKHVRFEPDLSHEQFTELLKRANAFIRFTAHDGDSMSVREALAVGTAVIASDACLRPEGTILVRAGNIDELAHAMSIAGTEKPAESPKVESSRERFMKLYKNLLNLHSSGRSNAQKSL